MERGLAGSNFSGAFFYSEGESHIVSLYKGIWGFVTNVFCAAGTPAEKSVNALCEGLGSVSTTVISFSNCQCKACEGEQQTETWPFSRGS